IRNDAIKRALPDRFIEGGVVICKNSNGDVADVFGAQVHFVVVVVGDVVVTTVDLVSNRGCNSVVECLLRMLKVLGSNPSTSKLLFFSFIYVSNKQFFITIESGFHDLFDNRNDLLTYGRQQHVIQQQCDGDDNENEPPRLPASLQPTAPVSTSHSQILSFL
ncbi:hypothetical protein ALC60_11837, partial [Trachymyrmex zeteki]